MWLSLYIGSLILGGVFVSLSVISGLGGDGDMEVDKEFEFDKEIALEFDKDFDLDADADADVDADLDLDGDGDVDADDLAVALAADKDIEVASGGRKFRPYLSFKFYTFSLAFFGLTGTLLTLLSGGVMLTFVLSLIMGLGSGLGMTYLLHAANRSEGGKVGTGKDLVGTTAKVTIPIRPGQMGKVKLRFKGQIVELMAAQYEPDEDDEEVVFDFDQECLVLGIEDGVVQVMHPSQLERRRKG